MYYNLKDITISWTEGSVKQVLGKGHGLQCTRFPRIGDAEGGYVGVRPHKEDYTGNNSTAYQQQTNPIGLSINIVRIVARYGNEQQNAS